MFSIIWLTLVMRQLRVDTLDGAARALEQTMTRVRVHNFTISLDGYGAGPLQTREEPLGVGGEALHEWFMSC